MNSRQIARVFSGRLLQMRSISPVAQVSHRCLSRLSSRQAQTSQSLRRLASPTVQRICQASTAVKFEIKNIQDEEDFKKSVIEASHTTPIVVDFHATWCGPCKVLAPRLESVLSEEGKAVMAKVDIDELGEVAMEYGVRSVPTVVGIRNGIVQDQFVGAVDEDQIRTFLNKLVS